MQTGQSYTNTVNVTLPDWLSGPYYLMVETDSSSQVFELDRSNNLVSTPITVAFNPAILTLTSAAAPTNGQAGHQIKVDWSVANTGTGDTSQTSWTDQVILSKSGVLGANDNIVVDSISRYGLAAGASYAQTDYVNLQNGFAGSYTLFVVADAQHTVAQSSYADDVYSQVIDIAPLPQLQVSAVSAPTNATAGDTIDVGWTVTDSGAVGTGAAAWTDAVYIDGFYVGSVVHSGGLAAGGSYTADDKIVVPVGFGTGDDIISVRADINGQVEEASNSSPTSTTSLDVTGLPATSGGGGGSGGGGATGGSGGGTVARTHPVLTVSAVGAPVEITSGQPLTVTWALANSGDATDASWYDEIYLSASPALDPATAVPLGYLVHTDTLAAGANATYSQTFTVPNYLSGYYYVIVSADNAQALSQPSRAKDVAASASPLQVDLPPVATSTALPQIEVTQVAAPASAADGQPITINYTVANLGSQGSVSTRTDSVYLSRTGVWAVDDALVGQVVVSGIDANATQTETLTATLPGISAGDYYVIVRSDVYNALPEANQALKTAVSATTVSVGVPSLTLGTPVSDALSAGGTAYYQFTVDAGEVVNLSLTGDAANAANDIYVSYGTTPTLGQFDATSTFPLLQSPTATIKGTQAGTYYVMVRESAGATENYTLTANTAPFSITSISPNVGSDAGTIFRLIGPVLVGNSAPPVVDNVTITIDGAQFSADEQVQLIGANGQSVTASQVVWANSGELWATVNVASLLPGAYDVKVSDATRGATLAKAFTVANLPTGHLAVSVSAPSALHTHNAPDGLPGTENGVVTITYANTGFTDIAAPILDLTATNANFIPGANGLIGTSEIAISGITQSGGPAGILQPGATESVSYTFHGYFGYAQFITMTLAFGVLQGGDDAIDWSSLASSTRPPTIDPTDWNLIWGRFEAQVGTTTQSLVNALSQDATTLSAIGQTTSDLASLLGYELDRASGALTAVTLSSADDLAMSGPGLDLSLSRSYSSSLVGRNEAGAFGDGWTFTYDIKAVTDSSGNVYIESPNGTETFALSGGAYVAASGDSSKLTAANGGYVLTTADGGVETFRADGQISSIRDAAGDLVSVAYDNNGVIRLRGRTRRPGRRTAERIALGRIGARSRSFRRPF